MDVPAVAVDVGVPVRFRVFVDFWNFQLTLNERVSHEISENGPKEPFQFQVDWLKMPQCLVGEAAKLVGNPKYSYDGTIVFTSYNPTKPADKKYHNWATQWLDKQTGIQVKCFERRPKDPPKCPACHNRVETCPRPECGSTLASTVEKGVDTAVATDMIRLAWERAYDVAVLATSDADLVPAVEFLDLKGVRVVQAGFPPHGSHLARACWGNLDIFKCRESFRRAASNF